MRRPLSYLLLYYAGGIFIRYQMGEIQTPIATVCLLTGGVLLAGGAFLLLGRKAGGLLLAAALAGVLAFSLAEAVPCPLEDEAGELAQVEGRVLSVKEKEYGYQIELLLRSRRVTPLGQEQEGGKGAAQRWVKTKGKLLLTLSGSSVPSLNGKSSNAADLTGCHLRVKGVVSLPMGRENPSGFDYRLYLKTRGIRVLLSAYPSHAEIIDEGNRLSKELARFRQNLLDALEPYMEEETRGLLMGILFGDKTNLDDDLYQIFQSNGTAHVLAVSGLHVGIVYLWIVRLFRGRKTLFADASAMGFLLLYAALSSFSPSVVRAVFMIGLHLLARRLLRPYDLLCGTSLAALCMLLWNPYQLFHTGFQLSFLAVFSLAFLLPPLRRFMDSRLERKAQTLGLSRPAAKAALEGASAMTAQAAAIQAGMAPVCAYLFNYFSLSAFILNLPVAALAAVILPLGILACFLSFFGGFPLGVTAVALDGLITLLVKLNELAHLPGVTSFHAVSPSPGLILLYYGILFFAASEGFWLLRKEGKRVRICITVLLLVGLSLLCPMALEKNLDQADLVFVSVGQGDCLHVRTPEGKNLLIDGGGSQNYDVGRKTLMPYLLKNGVRKVDLALVTHLHDDHYLGIRSLCQEGLVERLGLYEGNRLREDDLLGDTGLCQDQMLYLTAGQKLEIEEGIQIEILSPPARSEKEYEKALSREADENESSLLMRISFGTARILMTGDLGFSGEERALEEAGGLLPAAILKVGHHGSRYSTSPSFLAAVDPSLAVIQVGRNNNFGHPHPELIEKLRKNGIMIKRTDLQGAILVDVIKEGLRVRTVEPLERK